MESSGFCHAASKFLQTHQYLCIKVVTDYGLSSNLDLGILDRALQISFPKFIALIEQLALCPYVSEVPAESALLPMLTEIADKLKLTHQMQRTLKLEVRKALLEKRSAQNVLSRHLHAAIVNPLERRVILNAIIDELRSEKPI